MGVRREDQIGALGLGRVRSLAGPGRLQIGGAAVRFEHRFGDPLDRPGGEVKHLVTGAAMRPKFLGGDVPEIKSEPDYDAALQIEPDKLAVYSGIGCSGKTPHYINGYGFHTLHGRVLTVATGAVTQLTHDARANNFPAWSPDGQLIAFTSTRVSGRKDIWVVRPDGTGLRDVTNTTSNAEQNAAWSPDGTKLVYEYYPGLRVINVNGTGGRTLAGTGNRLFVEPSWSPDGSKLVFQERDAATEELGKLVVYDLATGKRRATFRGQANAIIGLVICSQAIVSVAALEAQAKRPMSLEDLLNYAYHRKSMKGKDTEQQDFHGDTAPMSAEALNKVGTAYRLYSAVYPALRAWTMLDNLIPFSPGYMMVAWGRKKAA